MSGGDDELATADSITVGTVDFGGTRVDVLEALVGRGVERITKSEGDLVPLSACVFTMFMWARETTYGDITS